MAVRKWLIELKGNVYKVKSVTASSKWRYENMVLCNSREHALKWVDILNNKKEKNEKAEEIIINSPAPHVVRNWYAGKRQHVYALGASYNL